MVGIGDHLDIYWVSKTLSPEDRDSEGSAREQEMDKPARKIEYELPDKSPPSYTIWISLTDHNATNRRLTLFFHRIFYALIIFALFAIFLPSLHSFPELSVDVLVGKPRDLVCVFNK